MVVISSFSFAGLSASESSTTSATSATSATSGTGFEGAKGSRFALPIVSLIGALLPLGASPSADTAEFRKTSTKTTHRNTSFAFDSPIIFALESSSNRPRRSAKQEGGNENIEEMIHEMNIYENLQSKEGPNLATGTEIVQ